MKSEIKKVEKPWGYELIFAHTEQYVGKVLHIKKDQQLSLQYHREKKETIFLFSGKMKFLFEESPGKLTEILMNAGDAHYIPSGKQHRMIAMEDCEIFEVSTPQLDDVVRIEDSYGRVK
jgi:mannose-6-phosphate isomerase